MKRPLRIGCGRIQSRGSSLRARWVALAGVCLLAPDPALAQIDPFKRELIHVGYNQALQGHAPLAAYAFYHRNQPAFLNHSNLTLRLSVAPVFLDTELGISQALGERTDLGVGLAGGGFAYSYSEVRGGKYYPSESFIGHGGEVFSALYHRFNPNQKIPLTGVLRVATQYTVYEDTSDLDSAFELPDDRGAVRVRAGLRWGGREPVTFPRLAMEVSGWYEGAFRFSSGRYGFNNDREVEPNSHLFWARALLAYTLPKLEHTFEATLTAGTSIEADRFSAYRLGGLLPMVSEFALNLPGYFFEELSADNFVLLGGTYTVPLDTLHRWNLMATVNTALVDYLDGLEQPGNWHNGVGAGIGYRSANRAWEVVLAYSYGIDAIRSHGRGAHSVGFLLQIDLTRGKQAWFASGVDPNRSRGLFRLLDL